MAEAIGFSRIALRKRADSVHTRVTLRALAMLLPVHIMLQPSATYADASFVQNGNAGFVVSHIAYALADGALETGACPQGMSLSVQDIFAQTAKGKRIPQESDDDYAARLRDGGNVFSTAPDGQNLCTNPEAGKPDPNYRTVGVSTMPVSGIDLDGGRATAANSCAHEDFTGRNGEPGIDNQFYRVVGCTRSFQPTGQSNGFDIEMLTGSWGILIALAGIDDIVNDDNVEVRFFANADPIQLSPTRDPLAYATYLVDPDPGFQAHARGRIENGILTTEPTDVQFHHVVNSMYLARPLRDARLQATLSRDGVLEGYLAGYTPVEAMYDFQYGYRNGKTRTGELAPAKLRAGSANGAAYVLGHTCNGVYYALYEHADGHPDADTGKCTSISTQYTIKAIPAFVIEDAGPNAQSNPAAEHADAR
jgi:hypothetical protein